MKKKPWSKSIKKSYYTKDYHSFGSRDNFMYHVVREDPKRLHRNGEDKGICIMVTRLYDKKGKPLGGGKKAEVASKCGYATITEAKKEADSIVKKATTAEDREVFSKKPWLNGTRKK